MEIGYTPLVRRSTRRDKGYYKRSYMKIFGILADNYRYRPRGESTFGSLINKFIDGMKIRKKPYNSNLG